MESAPLESLALLVPLAQAPRPEGHLEATQEAIAVRAGLEAMAQVDQGEDLDRE